MAVHTLGPAGTNCEYAARYWLNRRADFPGIVVLHDSLERAVAAMLADPRDSVMLGCIVYPALHELIFQNVTRMRLSECFVMPTLPMVVASRTGEGKPQTVASHAAPVNLLDGLDIEFILSGSNSQAAQLCAEGQADACITTDVAARSNRLVVLRNFGPIPMGFSVHVPV
ncbi:bacilysin biosynthesis protein BacA [Streptomyces sp. NPDC127051]|uniref:bacilysin biosynthesis protein BacA n=1 Tax=Streptomyces sp. NPDC127051 TaxID=3347119 RepID=UPI0036666138